MNTEVEKWLWRQKMGEVIGNLTVGALMGVLAVPLTLIHLAVLWIVIRVVRGGNPVAEVLGRGSMGRDNSITVAVVLFVVCFAAYLWWDRFREEKNKRAGKKDNDPSAMDIGLILLQIVFAAPAVVMTAVGFFRNILAWGSLDVPSCAAVLTRLLGSPHRVALETLQRELPNVEIEETLKQLKLIPGVVFLTSAPAGLSLTGELRQTFSRRSRRDDWKPPPREERFDFICMRCGQKLRLRRFQSDHSIRCPRCQARYRGRLDKFGRLRIEPEAERSHRRETRRSADELAPYYRTLDLPVTADLAALRRAYRRMMKQHHPDLYAMAEPAKRAQVEEKAKQINEAYHVLMDHLEEKS